MLLSIPTIPDRNLEFTGATFFGEELVGTCLSGEAIGDCRSQFFAATALLRALKNSESIPSLNENFTKWYGLTTAGPGLLPAKCKKYLWYL